MSTNAIFKTTPLDDLLRVRQGRVQLVDVPELPFVLVDGAGEPDGEAFKEAIAALYTTAYGVHFTLKRRGIQSKVQPLEACWTIENPAAAFAHAVAAGGFSDAQKRDFTWTAMIRLPDDAEQALVDDVVAEAAVRRPLPGLARVRFARWREGLAVQTLHVGPYADELPTVELLHRFIPEEGYMPVGRHHEISLDDPRRSAPERLRTLLRQPVARR